MGLDRLLGEPQRLHPLVGFGNTASALERLLRPASASPPASPIVERMLGIAGVAILIVPATLATAAISQLGYPGIVLDIIVLYFCIAPRSLEEHVQRVFDALQSGDLAGARAAVARMVSRDTETMSKEDIARAAVESVLENGNDAIFGALFWFLLLGAPGALAFRLANTLDAMWGYRTPAYLYFGWAAARLDDVLNWIPARLTALTYCLAGSTANALRCWRLQARHWYSPNAGPVMAAGAGALSVMLGGSAQYAGEWKDRPALGSGHPAAPADIEAAIVLLRRSLLIWLFAASGAVAILFWNAHV